MESETILESSIDVEEQTQTFRQNKLKLVKALDIYKKVNINRESLIYHLYGE